MGMQVQGRDYVFKSILYSHVGLYWMLVAAACCTAHDSPLHPLTALGEQLRGGLFSSNTNVPILCTRGD